ncbi:hypothetical protein JCM10212_005449 [Sporobolomyces blumeae]
MPHAPQTILDVSRSAPLPRLDPISLLPCSLAFDGPAPISTYFHPRPYVRPDAQATLNASTRAKDREGPGESKPRHRQVALRGRRLVSSFLDVPKGYRGLVFSTTQASPPTAAARQVDEEEARLEKNRRARQERAAKRTKVDETEDYEAQTGKSDVRRSPRKAAREARERAVKAAKERANAKGKGNGAVKRWSLDEDEDEDEGAQEEEGKEGGADDQGRENLEQPPKEGGEEEMQIEGGTTERPEEVETTLPVEAAALETIESSGDGQEVDTVSTTTVATVLEATCTSVESCDPEPVAALPPPPLLHRTSTSLSTHLDVPTTPLPSSSLSRSSSFADPVVLARDEKHLTPFATFDQIEVWNPDFCVAGGRVEQEDDVARGIVEWLGIANKSIDVIHTPQLHAY